MGQDRKFDVSADRLLDLADEKMETGDQLGALRLLHKSIEMYGPAADEYASLADAYEEMGLFLLSADCWFRYLDVCAEEDAVDGYEGLASCFYNLGNEERSAYYFSKMTHDAHVTPLHNFEIGELLRQQESGRETFRVIWPPERADYSAEIEEGLNALRVGDFEKAEEAFLRVHPASEGYSSAMNYLAVVYLLSERADKAEELCCKLLERTPDDVSVLSTYVAVLAEQGRTEEGRAVAERLARIPTKNPDELYKIATVCCEHKLYDAAYKHFCVIENIVNYDRPLLYFKAVAAFKSGRLRESAEALGKLLDIFPTAAVARYYYREIRRYMEDGKDAPEIDFFYRLPKNERDDRIKALLVLAEMHKKELKAFCAETDISELIEWCFDEMDGQDMKLQILGATVAFRCDLPDFILDEMLSLEVSDAVKLECLRLLCEKNKSFDCNIVVGEVLRKISFDKLEVGKERRAAFVKAYARSVARFAALDEEPYPESYRVAAIQIYEALAEQGALAQASDIDALACAIHLAACGADGKKAESAAFFGTANARKVSYILAALGKKILREEIAVTEGGKDEAGETAGEDSDETH